ncbi:MAG: phage portal protein family protein [Promethearchaeota archaeon]
MPTRVNEFYSNRKPILVSFDDQSSLDDDLKKLRKVMIEPNYNNLEEAFWNDSIAVSFTDITAAVIVGDGLRIRCKNEKALEIIKNWCRKINVRRQTVEDFMRDAWFDLVVYGLFLWRVDDRSVEYDDVDIQRIDPKSIEIWRDPVMGYQKFVQRVSSYKFHKKKSSFYRNAGKKGSTIWYRGNYYKNWEVKFDHEPGESLIEIHIPDTPRNVIFSNYFRKPPIANAIHYIIYKRWILWFMRKYSQKHWAPFTILRVGDPKSNIYPQQKHLMQEALNKGRDFIRQITNFGGVAIPGEMELKTLETQTAKSSEIYVLYIRELDKQIMYTIYGSMGQRDASGNELATSRQLQEGWLRFIKNIRRLFELVLTEFFAECLLPYHGIEIIRPQDIEIDFSPLRLDSTEELMKSIKIGAEIGMWNDKAEMRKAAQPAFAFIDEFYKKSDNFDPIVEEGAKNRLMEHYKQRKNK